MSRILLLEGNRDHSPGGHAIPGHFMNCAIEAVNHEQGLAPPVDGETGGK